ncbi:MAG: peroxidase-related enzyme [Pseudomonadota bacterium]
MTHFSYAKNFQGVADVFLRAPAVYRPLLDFIETVMIGPSALSKEEREIIAAHVSRLNGCDFCVAAHRATLAAMGVSPETLATLDQGANIEKVSAAVRPLLVFAEKLTRSPDAVRQTDIDALTGLGIAEQTIEDAVNVISLFNYVNRLVDAFGVEGSPDYFKLVGRSLAANGYANLLGRSQ